jgi:hypothetical protein
MPTPMISPRLALWIGLAGVLSVIMSNAPVLAQTAPPPSSAAPADDGPTIPVPPTTDFEEASFQVSVVKPTAVYLAPSKAAPAAYPVTVGTVVDVIAQSKDGSWAWVNTVDGAPAYIPMDDLAPPPAPAQ